MMKEFLQGRQLKYVAYYCCLIVLILITTFLISIDDREFGAMMLILFSGLITGQIVYAIRQLDFNWFTSIIYELIITTIGFKVGNEVAKVIAKVVALLAGLSHHQEEQIMIWLAFICFVGVTELLWEIANKYYKK